MHSGHGRVRVVQPGVVDGVVDRAADPVAQRFEFGDGSRGDIAEIHVRADLAQEPGDLRRSRRLDHQALDADPLERGDQP